MTFAHPAEIRLQIFPHLFDLDLRICPHHQRRLVVLTRQIVESKEHVSLYNVIEHTVKYHKAFPNRVPNLVDSSLAALSINHQIRIEVSDICVLYLEHCFTYFQVRQFSDSFFLI